MKRYIYRFKSALLVLPAVSLLLAGFVVFNIKPASATPTTMNFQGRLTDSTGAIMPDGLYNMQFRLYTVASGGTATWSETRQTTSRVQVTNGLFSTQLGQVNPLSPSLFSGNDVYFEITMPTPATATCSTAGCASWEAPMSPRNKLATSAYAFRASTADTATNANALGGQTASFFQNASNLNAGTINSARISGAYGGITGVGTITSGTWQGTTIAVARGGTGATTAQGAINNLSGLTTAGDLLFHNGTNSTRLARGTTGQCLTSTATSLQWGSCGVAGANTSLSNLTATSINQSLIAGTNNTLDLGSTALGWRSGYFGTAVNAPLFDRANAGALNIGTTNATAITVGQTSGASSLTLNSGTGGVRINGATDVAGDTAITISSINTTSGAILNSATKLVSTFDPTGLQNGAFFGNTLWTNPGTTGAQYAHDFISTAGIASWEGAGNTSTATGRVIGLVGKVQHTAGAGSIVNAMNVMGGGQIQSGTPITNMYNIYSDDVQGGGSVVNLYGLYSKHLTGGTTSNYPLYLDSDQGYALFSVANTGATTLRTSTNQANAFRVQNAAGTSIITADTVSGSVLFGQAGTHAGTLRLANATNSNTVSIVSGVTSASYTLTLPTSAGSAGQCLIDTNGSGVLGWQNCSGASGGKKIILTAEYAGAVLKADGSNNNGTMTSDFVGGLPAAQGYKHSYYDWSTSQTTAQDYDIYITHQLPNDFNASNEFDAGSWKVWTYVDHLASSGLTMTVYDADGTVCANAVSIKGATTGWSQVTLADFDGVAGCDFTASSVITIKISMSSASPSSNHVRVADIEYSYTPN